MGTDRIDDQSFAEDFRRFVCQELADGSTRGPVQLVLEAEGGNEEAALRRWFALYDEFRRFAAEHPDAELPDPWDSAERFLPDHRRPTA